MSPPITHKNLQNFKPRNDIFIHKRGRMHRRIGFDCLGLRSLGEVLGGDHDVSRFFGRMEMDFSHIIDPPLLKRHKRQ